MASTIEFALMAGRAYQTNRAQVNQFAIPAGWQSSFMFRIRGSPRFLGQADSKLSISRKVWAQTLKL